jgi:hypothetical protein
MSEIADRARRCRSGAGERLFLGTMVRRMSPSHATKLGKVPSPAIALGALVLVLSVSPAAALERWHRCLGIGHGPGYHAYGCCPWCGAPGVAAAGSCHACRPGYPGYYRYAAGPVPPYVTYPGYFAAPYAPFAAPVLPSPAQEADLAPGEVLVTPPEAVGQPTPVAEPDSTPDPDEGASREITPPALQTRHPKSSRGLGSRSGSMVGGIYGGLPIGYGTAGSTASKRRSPSPGFPRIAAMAESFDKPTESAAVNRRSRPASHFDVERIRRAPLQVAEPSLIAPADDHD